MRKHSIFIAIFIFALSFTIRAQDGLQTKDIEAIKNIMENYRTAWLKNNEKTVLSLFTDDASLYPNGNKPVKGKDEITKFWFAPSDTITTINAFEIKIEDISGDKNYATVIGSNELKWSSEKKDKTELKHYLSKGYFMTIYVKRNKEWKIFRQFWNAKTEEIK